jgi:Na+/proline symporter
MLQEGATSVEIAVNGYATGAFVGYLVLLLAIGVYSARFSSAGIGEFFVGGRRMNRLVVALSAAVLILVVIAILLSLTADDLVFWLVLFAWAGLGPPSAPRRFWPSTGGGPRDPVSSPVFWWEV